MNKLLVTEEMLKIKSDIELINTDLETMFNDINTNLDSIVLNWKGNKANKVLAPVDGIKIKNTDILTKMQAKSEEIKNAYETYLKISDTYIEASSNTSSLVAEQTDKVLKPEEIKNDVPTSSSYTSLPGFTTPSSYVNDYLNKIIDYTKTGNGANPFDKEDMSALSSLYNSTPNVRTQGESLFTDFDKNLKVVENKIKKSGLWGTPEASAILMHYAVKTGFRIPTYPTTKTDGVGNYRHLGTNNGWLDNNNGLDCNNVLSWIAINSGRMKENQHVYVPKSNYDGTISLGNKDLTGISLYDQGIRPGDSAGRKDHATVFMYEDKNNIYVFESVSDVTAKSNRKLNEGGTMITIIPKNPNEKINNDISVAYPRAHINYFVPFESIPQVNNPANPSTIKK